MFYGRDSFKEGRDSIAYPIEVDIAGGACGIEAGTLDGKTVSAIAYFGYEDCINNVWRFVKQTMKGRA